MKKYLAAAVVAVMVFAFAAFAASLDVDAGTLAAGQDDVDDCGGTANVSFDTQTVGGGAFGVNGLDIEFAEDCEGFALVQVLDTTNNAYGFYIGAIDDGSVSFSPDPSSTLVEEVGGVSVLVKSVLNAGEQDFMDSM